ncbi:hypothetical protein [Streptomyces sp. SPB162]|uniref:hypothetical protein n=1 Tax=Streptomyces sp. SPB162 TaxID=2940560 RepID=UPI00240491E4|nr:hypothetical protein [Streptomyces sp. SPB162]
MRFQYTVAACAAALAVLIVPLAATPAAAALPTTSDTVTEHEFSGHMDIGWRVQPYRLDPIQITLKDTATDGYSIGIRLVTYGENGKIIWKLRTIPAGQDTAYWTTYAEPGGYISSGLLRRLQDQGEHRHPLVLRVLEGDERPVRRLLGESTGLSTDTTLPREGGARSSGRPLPHALTRRRPACREDSAPARRDGPGV